MITVSIHDLKTSKALLTEVDKIASRVIQEGIDAAAIPMDVIVDVVGIDSSLYILERFCGDLGSDVCLSFAVDCALNGLTAFDGHDDRDNLLLLLPRYRHVSTHEALRSARNTATFYDSCGLHLEFCSAKAVLSAIECEFARNSHRHSGMSDVFAQNAALYGAKAAGYGSSIFSQERSWQAHVLKGMVG